MVESRAFPAVSMSFLWLMGFADRPMILAPQYYGTYSILVMQASKEASIQSLILFPFSLHIQFFFAFSFCWTTSHQLKSNWSSNIREGRDSIFVLKSELDLYVIFAIRNGQMVVVWNGNTARRRHTYQLFYHQKYILSMLWNVVKRHFSSPYKQRIVFGAIWYFYLVWGFFWIPVFGFNHNIYIL